MFRIQFECSHQASKTAREAGEHDNSERGPELMSACSIRIDPDLETE